MDVPTLVRYEQGTTMAITVPVNLTPAEEAALAARANAEGVSVESLLHEAVLHLIAAYQGEGRAALTPDQWERELLEWLNNMPDMPCLSDEAISRESIYTREDEWR
jgi:valyl-tRNA synthetase